MIHCFIPFHAGASVQLEGAVVEEHLSLCIYLIFSPCSVQASFQGLGLRCRASGFRVLGVRRFSVWVLNATGVGF